MRPIDADALDYALGASDEDIYFHHMLEDAPTIDAIPVEWLKEYQLENQRQGNYDMVGAIEVMMWNWEKEQEAR